MADEDPLDLQSLRCFEAALGQPSFRAAAEKVHLSPAAFGERIARLEDQLGAALFERTTRKLELTPAGERLRPHARNLLAMETELRSLQLDEQSGRAPFELTLGTRFELGMSWLVPQLGALEAEEPGLTLHLAFGDTDALLHRLDARRVDALVSSARISKVGLAYAPLHDERYVFVGQAAAMKAQPIRQPEDARHHTLVDARVDVPLFRYFLDAAPPEPSWAFAKHLHMGTIAAVRARICSGDGVGVLPAYYVQSELERGELVELMPEHPCKQDVFRLIWRERHPRDAELRRMADRLARAPLR